MSPDGFDRQQVPFPRSNLFVWHIRGEDVDVEELLVTLESVDDKLRELEKNTQSMDESVWELSRVLSDSSFEDSAANHTRIELLALSEIIADSDLV